MNSWNPIKHPLQGSLIKQRIGNSKERVDYLIDSTNNNNKVKTRRKIFYIEISGKKIFEIPSEENQNFDIENENLVK